MGTAIYQQAQAQQASQGGSAEDTSAGAQNDDEVVEAEIVDEGDSETGAA
jgi:hypothetical protein